ncbi:MAG: cytochrome P450 [Limisphaerales bacterium]|jgi:cytochrome P450
MNAVALDINKPLSLASKDLAQHRFEYYAYLRNHRPVHQAKILGMKVMVTSRYEDCLYVAKSDDFLRNRGTITGGSRLPFPMPKSISFLAESMITQDDPEHRRLRTIVQKAFAPKNINPLTDRVEAYCHELLDKCLMAPEVDLQRDFALPLPTRVIGEMIGVKPEEMHKIQNSVRILSTGLTGWSIVRTMAWDLRKIIQYFRELIEAKRQKPGDDLLSALIHSEEDGEQLTEDELVSLVFLLIIAGFETTVHLITNGAIALLDHPHEMQKLRETPELMGSTVEEMLRYAGPVHGTKMNYAVRDLELRGVRIPKAMPVMPLLGSANRDEEIFPDAEKFDIARDPNKHLAFSQGNHFCLGAFLARMETKTAFQVLLDRTQDIALSVPREQLEVVAMPGWHRHNGLPVTLR